MEKKLVLFDGVCTFCNYWVQFAIKRDKKGILSFGSLQGKTAAKLLPEFGVDPNVLTSVIFLNNGKMFTSSTAVLEICRHLGGGWKFLYAFKIVPTFLRDGIYNWIGKHRYQWFGKKEECMIPTPQQRTRFVE